MADRNPSPPPAADECEENGDRIGQSVFSETYVYQTLRQLTIYVQEDKDEEREDVVREVQELDKAFEGGLCVLWDMTTDKDVVAFLCGIEGAVGLFCSGASITRQPRLSVGKEISVGILVNVLTNTESPDSVAGSERIRCTMLYLLEGTDAPTVVQVLSFLERVVQLGRWDKDWCDEFERNDSARSLLYILKNSTNELLLNSCCSLLAGWLGAVDTALQQLAVCQDELVDSLTAGLDELCSRHADTANLYYVAHACTTSEQTCSALANADTQFVDTLIAGLEFVELNEQNTECLVQIFTALLPHWKHSQTFKEGQAQRALALLEDNASGHSDHSTAIQRLKDVLLLEVLYAVMTP